MCGAMFLKWSVLPCRFRRPREAQWCNFPLATVGHTMVSHTNPVHGRLLATLVGLAMGSGRLHYGSANGERVNRIATVEGNREFYPSHGLGCLQLSTNYGRVATFGSLRFIRESTIQSIPFEPSETITGLVSFEQQRVPPEPTVLDPERNETPDEQLQYDCNFFSYFINSSNPGNFQTYASLKNVRKLQASTGVMGRCRSAHRISGLKIEYYDHPSPGIVVQWMNELDDGFELPRDEEIELLTILLSPVGTSLESPGRVVGQVPVSECDISFEYPGWPARHKATSPSVPEQLSLCRENYGHVMDFKRICRLHPSGHFL
ncbi:hypothetical protein BDV59DRAFT_142213 [Aspergillus ambiguus]|uniref:uncharacterized protein n=1 Tax=Aspergillus ambiguus TaxID=176160 RepID=UPI003CCD8EA1